MKTKIVATIGPASLDFETMKKMVDEGMAIARLNTKYGSVEQYQGVMENLKKLNRPLMFDVKGPDQLDWLMTQDFEYLAVSFAETAEQVLDIRAKFMGKPLKIIAKIESGKGIDRLEELIKVSDGIMVARGDLGRNIKLEDVPVFQKIIIKKCNEMKKMVITATEMLLSMTHSQTPERAEVSDVANAVLDGTDFVMLSEETSTGQYPVEAVAEMRRIIEEVEAKSKLLE
ncbi:MAG: pyruvate kinase [Candidatus Berkelbacteria bacterium]